MTDDQTNDDQTPEEVFEDNIRALLEITEPFESIGVTEAELHVLTRSKRGSHRMNLYLDLEPEDLDIRHLQPLAFGLAHIIMGMRALGEDRLESSERDREIRSTLGAVEDGSVSAEEAVEAIQALMSAGEEEGNG